MGQLNLISSYYYRLQHQKVSIMVLCTVYNLHPKQWKVFISASAKTVQHKNM